MRKRKNINLFLYNYKCIKKNRYYINFMIVLKKGKICNNSNNNNIINIFSINNRVSYILLF